MYVPFFVFIPFLVKWDEANSSVAFCFSRRQAPPRWTSTTDMKSIMLRSVVSPRHLNLVLRPTLCSSGNVSTALTQFTAPVAASAPSYGFSVRGMSSPTASSAVVEDAAAKKPGGVNMGGKNSAGSGEEAGRTAGILLFCSLVSQPCFLMYQLVCATVEFSFKGGRAVPSPGDFFRKGSSHRRSFRL